MVGGIKQLIEKEVNNETTEDKWRHCTEYIIMEGDKLSELAYIAEVVVDSLINNNVDSSDDTNSDTDIEGIELFSESNW